MSSESTFADLFHEDAVRTGVRVATKDDLLTQLVDIAVAGGKLQEAQRASILTAVTEREKLGSTGIGMGIGIPHVKVDGVTEVVTAVAVCTSKLDFNAVDGEPCDVFFLLVSPKAHAERHLQVLRWISRLARNPDFVRFLRHAKNPGDVVSLLREMGE